MEGERIVGIVSNAEGQVGRMSLPKLYDLVFTDRRLVGIVTVKTGKARLAGQLLGGVVGNAIAGSIAKGGADQRRASYAGQSLDQIVTRDKANFAAAYTDIENPRIKGMFSKRLEMHVAGKKAFFRLPAEEVPRMQSLVRYQLGGSPK